MDVFLGFLEMHNHDLSRVRCYACNEFGHVRRECTNRNRGASSNAQVDRDGDESSVHGTSSRGGSVAGEGWSG